MGASAEYELDKKTEKTVVQAPKITHAVVTTSEVPIKVLSEKIGVSVEEVLFLDDNLNADKTAKSAGMKVCGVYDDSSKDYVEEMKAATDCYIYDFEELLSLQL